MISNVSSRSSATTRDPMRLKLATPYDILLAELPEVAPRRRRERLAERRDKGARRRISRGHGRVGDRAAARDVFQATNQQSMLAPPAERHPGLGLEAALERSRAHPDGPRQPRGADGAGRAVDDQAGGRAGGRPGRL